MSFWNGFVTGILTVVCGAVLAALYVLKRVKPGARSRFEAEFGNAFFFPSLVFGEQRSRASGGGGGGGGNARTQSPSRAATTRKKS